MGLCTPVAILHKNEQPFYTKRLSLIPQAVQMLQSHPFLSRIDNIFGRKVTFITQMGSESKTEFTSAS